MPNVKDITISHASVISLRTQLHNQLQQLILSGRWSTGTRIPSESELASHLNISRSTIRLALQQAEIEGLIERRAGRGTFVSFSSRAETSSRLIAFVTCDSDSDSQLVLLTGAESQAKALGYRIVFASAASHQEQMDLLVKLRNDNVAGVLLWSSPDFTRTAAENRAAYTQVGIPIVAIDRTIEGFDCDCVTSDNYGGALGLTQYLTRLGHRSIVFLSHQEFQIPTIQERYRAYADALRTCGVEPKLPLLIGSAQHELTSSQALRDSSNPKSTAIQQIITFFHETIDRPTAIVAVSDTIAIIALKALKLLKLKVPDDISLVGFDDIDMALHLEPPLTTVAQNYFAMGTRATELLVERLNGISSSPKIVYLPTELRIRGSAVVQLRIQSAEEVSAE